MSQPTLEWEEWEYMIEDGDDDFFGMEAKRRKATRLNELGELGWELVQILPIQQDGEAVLIYFFKRLKVRPSSTSGTAHF